MQTTGRYKYGGYRRYFKVVDRTPKLPKWNSNGSEMGQKRRQG